MSGGRYKAMLSGADLPPSPWARRFGVTKLGALGQQRSISTPRCTALEIDKAPVHRLPAGSWHKLKGEVSAPRLKKVHISQRRFRRTLLLYCHRKRKPHGNAAQKGLPRRVLAFTPAGSSSGRRSDNQIGNATICGTSGKPFNDGCIGHTAAFTHRLQPIMAA